MNSLSSMLEKQIDLILEAYTIDDNGGLVEANKKKVVESDNLFHQYFVGSMNKIFQRINENDPVMGMHDGQHHNFADMEGMHGYNDPMQGHEDHGGHMGLELQHGNDEMFPQAEEIDGEHGFPGDMMHGTMGTMDHNMREGAGEFDWIGEEVGELDIDSLFQLTEDDEEEEKDDDEELNEFDGSMHHGHDDHEGDEEEFGDAPMDSEGGHTGFDGDMGGMSDMNGDDDMDLDSGLDHQESDEFGSEGGDEFGGGDDDDMITIHGTTDSGGDFEFSFDPNTLGLGEEGDDMGGENFGSHGDEFGSEGGDDLGGDEDFTSGGDMNHGMDQPGDGSMEDEHEEEHHRPMEESVKKGKVKTSKMGIVPGKPKARNARPMGTN